MKTAYSSLGAAALPIYVATDLGLFAKHGIDASVSYLSPAPTLTAAALSGEVPIGVVTQEGVITADLQGADLVIIGTGPDRLQFSVYAQPKITTVGDLKGAKLGISRVGSATDFAARHLLGRAGLTPGTDVTIVQVGGAPELVTALDSGAVDAVVHSPPTTYALQKKGYRELVDFSREDLPYYQSAVIARKSWLKDNQGTATNYMRAMLDAVKVIREEPQQAADVLGKYLKENDKDILTRSIADLSRILPADQTPKPEGVKAGLDLVSLTEPKAKDANPAQFVDATFAQAAGKPRA